MSVVVRPMSPADFAGVVALQRFCFPEPFPVEFLWTKQHLASHVEKFAAGQFVAELEGEIIGSASSARIAESTWNAHLNWEQTLGGFTFDGHDPVGNTLYGADISVHPSYRGRGVGRKLYEARFQLVRELHMARFGTACRLPDCKASGLAPELFAQLVQSTQMVDRTLTPLLRYGLQLVSVIPNYMEDEESLNSAALLEWVPR